jgi:hypothetical protein
MPRVQAFAEDGPLGGDPNLTVQEGDGKQQATVIWRTGPGPDERHLYRFKEMALTPTGVPVYEFVRTLRKDEADPKR